jgi:hypothetical protein
MNIEIAPKEYWIRCIYNEALLYCFQLGIDGKTGWRLPTRDEYNIYSVYIEPEVLPVFPWFIGDEGIPLTYTFLCIPIRTI